MSLAPDIAPCMRLFLTSRDERALVAALRREFSDLKFLGQPPFKSTYEFTKNVAASSFKRVYMTRAAAAWRPDIRKNRETSREEIANLPEQTAVLFRRQEAVNGKTPTTSLGMTVLEIRFGATPSQTQIAFTRRMWRVVKTIAPHRLNVLQPDCRWTPVSDPATLAGHDAVRWALQHKERRFEDADYFRPRPPTPCRLPSRPARRKVANR